MTEPIKEDFLEVDAKIPGQNYVCLSFVSPEKVIKRKETFFTSKFLEYLFNSDDMVAQDIRNQMLNKTLKFEYKNIEQLYEDWKYSKNDDLESEFFELNDYKTSMRALKVRGVYDSQKEASVRAQLLRKRDPSFNVFVGQIGYWLPWDPECESVQDQEYQEGQLNELVKKYKENLNNRDDLYEQVKSERIEKAKKEVDAKKEIIRAQSDIVVHETTSDDIKNIETLRSIVDESDKLYYDNLNKTQEDVENIEVLETESTSENKELPESESSSENQEVPETESTIENNNFKSDVMQNLENDDPWLRRKKEE
jgi:hypothetical protein